MPNTKDNAIKILGTGLALAVSYLVDLIIADEIADGVFSDSGESIDKKRKEYYFMLGDTIIDQAIDASELSDNEVSSLQEFFEIFYGMGAGSDEPEVLSN